MTASLLLAEGVSRRHRGATVVDDVSLDVGGGTVLAVAGPAGSGKTALLAVLAGILPATSGRVEIDGAPLFPGGRRDGRRARRRVGYVAPAGPVDDAATIRQHLLLHAACQRVRRRDRPGLVEGLLELLDLEAVATMPLGGAPAGVAQLVAIARALVADPPVLLLDDPTRGLDLDHRDGVLHLIEQLAGLGKAVVLATEPNGDGLAVASHVADLESGRVVRFAALTSASSSSDPVPA